MLWISSMNCLKNLRSETLRKGEKMYEVNNFLTNFLYVIGIVIVSIMLGWELCTKKNNKNNEKKEKNGQKPD
jgi:uncharacterized membrane protein YkvI